MELSKLITDSAPYLIPVLASVLLIVFVKRTLFAGMMSTETYREQLEREKAILVSSENIVSQLEDILLCQQRILGETNRIIDKIEGLTAVVDEQLGRHTDRLTSVERSLINHLRSILPHEVEASLKKEVETCQKKEIGGLG